MSRSLALVYLALILSGSVLAASPVPPAAAAVDPQALTLLLHSAQAMLDLKTYQAECDTTLSFPPNGDKPARERRHVSKLQAAKPNKMYYDQRSFKRDADTGGWVPDPKDQGGITFVCDGKTLWNRFGDNYRKTHTIRPEHLQTILEPWGGFYDFGSSPVGLMVETARHGGLLELRRAGREAVEGVRCEKVSDHFKTQFGGEIQEGWETWYIGEDGLVRRHVERIEFDGKPGFTSDDVLRNMHINLPIAETQFAFKVPPGVKMEQ